MQQNLIPSLRAADARKRLEGWRRILRSVFEPISDTGSADELAELLGSASVATMAELECFMRDLVDSLARTINGANVAVSSLRPELRVIHAHTKFESIRNLTLNNDNFWARRTEVSKLHMCSDFASLPARKDGGPQPPLRGRTFSVSDIFEVANVFGFYDPERLLNNAHISTSLKKLSVYRNAYAHATVPPIEIFPHPEREAVNIIAYIGHICGLFDILAEDWERTIDDKLYLDISNANSVDKVS